MIIPKKVLKKWGRVIKDIGVTATCAGAGVNFRTFKRALEVEQCRDEVYDKVEAFVTEREKEVKRKLTPVEDDNN